MARSLLVIARRSLPRPPSRRLPPYVPASSLHRPPDRPRACRKGRTYQSQTHRMPIPPVVLTPGVSYGVVFILCRACMAETDTQDPCGRRVPPAVASGAGEARQHRSGEQCPCRAADERGRVRQAARSVDGGRQTCDEGVPGMQSTLGGIRVGISLRQRSTC